MNKKLFGIFGGTLITFLFLIAVTSVSAQVTTAALKGKITDQNGNPLPGANVVAIHVPSGSRSGVSTRTNGRYNLPNLRVGGPYTVIVSFVGYKKQKKKNIHLSLGKTETINFQLAKNVSQLSELTVTANKNINNDQTGASTTIDEQSINNIPTINRSTEDVYQLSPSASGNSFAGRNQKYNNYTLDGSILNNPFGLNKATPGGQTNSQPVSLDAISQIKVSLAPYDVTQSGFTGASVNVVTKSGTNTYKGSVFGYFRNQSFNGSKVSGRDLYVPSSHEYQTGIDLGGPIIKNKLFFFANFELNLNNHLGSSYLPNTPNRMGPNVSRVKKSDLVAVSDILKSRYDYDTGPFGRYTHKTNNGKGLFKLNWNINNHNSLSATFNYLHAFKDDNRNPDALGRGGPDQTTLQFFNSGYRIYNNVLSGIVELRSNYGSNFSNKLQLGYTHLDSKRDPFSSPFPVLNIAKNGIRYIVAGYEPFSLHNRLDQKVYQVTDNFNAYLGDHSLTFGSSFKAFLFNNSFNLGTLYSGQPGGTFSGAGFKSVQAFLDYVNSGKYDSAVKFARETYQKKQENNSWDLAEANIGELSVYAQDNWSVTDNFSLKYGLRANFPFYFNTAEKIREIIKRKGGTVDKGGSYDPSITYYDENGNPVHFNSTELPSKRVLISPRLGFNWDVIGNQSLKLRGGSGLFTGRLPFVWIENQVANTGYSLYNVSSHDFKFPQVWRSDIGIDKSFQQGWLISADFIYSNDINSVLVRNYGLGTPSGHLNAPSNREIYLNSDRAKGPNGEPTNAYVFTNSNKGRNFNLTFKIEKHFNNNFFASVAYNYNNHKSLSSIDQEISSNAFDSKAARGNVNKPSLAFSKFGNKHKIVVFANKKFTYGKWATGISLFFNYIRGGRFSYTYSGDANNDDSVINDLIYVPTKSELENYKFSGNVQEQATQRKAFNNFIEQNDYLRGRRGKFAQKNAQLLPWYSQYNVRLTQDLHLGSNTLQLSLNMLNLGNLINSNWGIRQETTNTQPIGISVDPKTKVPTYSFDSNLQKTFTDRFDLESRWRLQLGIRYSFH